MQFPWLETQRLRARGYHPRMYRLMLWRQTVLIRLAYTRWVPSIAKTWAIKLFDNVEAIPESRVPCV